MKGCRIFVPLLLLAVSSSSDVGFRHAQARALQHQSSSSSSSEVAINRVYNSSPANEESKMILRAQIGSHPPRCSRRCFFCRSCVAVQVPTNPQVRTANSSSSSGGVPVVIAYARGDDASNYKPMSWKCKCGDVIFNP